MSCVHYKFKSSLEYDTITFDDLHVSLKELRDAICKAKKIGQSTDHTLEIVNAQTKKKYEDEQEMIPRNTSVIVQRVPVNRSKQVMGSSQEERSKMFPQSELPKLLSAEEMIKNKMANLATANATEEEKLKVMMSQSGEGFDPSKYPTKPMFASKQPTGQIRQPPPSYVCFRCGQRGHWLKMCPTQGDSRYDNIGVKPLTGIPASQLVSLDHHVPGAMIDRHGNYVIRQVDYEAMLKRQAKSSAGRVAKETRPIPDELKCSICSELMKEAVIIQCCGESFCDECIRNYLLENEFTCPKCSETDVSPDTLMANKALRTAVKNHLNVESDSSRMNIMPPVAVVTTTTAVAKVVDKPPVAMTMTMPSSTTTAPADTNKKAAFQLLSQLEHNLLIKHNVSSAAQEVITSDLLTDPAESAASATVSRSKSPTPKQPTVTGVQEMMAPQQQTAPTQQQTPVTIQQQVTPQQSTKQTTVVTTTQAVVTTHPQVTHPVVTQPITITAAPTAPVMSFPSNSAAAAAAAAAFKPALLPTPAGIGGQSGQLDAYTVAAAAALLLASGGSGGSSGGGGGGSSVTTAPDPASLLAADQLIQKELDSSRSKSPAPLSAEEFYRQQNRLKYKSKRKHSSSTSDSPVRSSHKRKHHHHHSDKTERRKHREHKSKEEKLFHKHKKKKHRHQEESKEVVDKDTPQHSAPEDNVPLTDSKMSSKEAKTLPQDTKSQHEDYDDSQPCQDKEDIESSQESLQDTRTTVKDAKSTKPVEGLKHLVETKASQDTKHSKPSQSSKPVQDVESDTNPSPDMKKSSQEAKKSIVFKAPARSVVTVVKPAADKKVLKIAPDLESPILPPSCLQHFAETPDASCTKEMDFTTSSSNSKAAVHNNKSTTQTANDEDGIEEGEILESAATHSPIVLHNPPQSHARKIKRKSSQSLEETEQTSGHSKLKKRKWKKDKDRDSSEKPKKHKIKTK